MLGSSPSDLVLPVALLEDVANESQESGGVRAVERAVIERQREITDWSHAHRPPAGAIGDGGGTHAHSIGREDGHLWWVDDGRTHHRAVAARVGDGERAAAEVVSTQLARTRLGSDGAETIGHRYQTQPVGLAHHRYDEAFELEVDRDAEIDLTMYQQGIVGKCGVQLRELAQRIDHRTTYEWEVRQMMGGPHRLNGGVVDFDDHQCVRRSFNRVPEICRDAFANGSERDNRS